MVEQNPGDDAQSAQPAVLADEGDANVAALKTALAQALGTARVELGAANLTESSTVSILPPPPHPNETHSLASPILFDLAIIDGNCAAVEHKTGKVFNLNDVSCVVAAGDD